MSNSTRISLSLLMFLQYFIWGAWYVTLGNYLFTSLKTDAIQVGSAYATFSIAAIISPFFVGMIADKFFSAQKVLAALHFLGALTLYYVSTIGNFDHFWWFILFYTILYTPTISLANSISFHKLNDTGKEFPAIRVFGTIGWIAAGLIIGLMGMENSSMPFKVAATCSLLLSIYSLFLSDTPPNKNRKVSFSSIIGLDAFVLFKNRSFLMFFIASVLICIPLTFYYNFTNAYLNNIGLTNAAGKMTLGQVSEVVFMLSIPFLFSRLGVKKMLMIGIAAWVIRYLFFAYGNVDSNIWMLYGGIILHGVCYDFFFVTGQIYTDSKAGEAFKSSAQGLITLATYGIGMFIGSYVSGYLTELFSYQQQGVTHYDWKLIWLMPASIGLAVLILLAAFFKEEKGIKIENL